MFFALISGTGNWVTSYALLYIILILGALITAGVAMSLFHFKMINIGVLKILELSLGFIIQIGIHPTKMLEKSKEDL